MRGKACFFQLGDVPAGITPAYAGKRCRGSVPGSCTRDHPRLCGEKSIATSLNEGNAGSPPPMRGKDIHSGKFYRIPGITPAYAGKSVSPIENWRYRRDHPRLCGEKASLPPFCPCPWGSPPPMRGKGKSKIQDRFVFRITPAYAGKSRYNYPRRCTSTGSPPPMRGKARKSAAAALSGRITPAYAGKRYTPWHLWNRYKDHPRLCGEKFSFLRQPMRLPGSPPPMRGKDISNFRILILSRITPAYAGKSKL